MRLSFQEPATGIMEGIINLHNYILIYMVYILVFVLWFLLSIRYNYKSSTNYSGVALKKTMHQTTLETVWTIIPAFILCILAIPSFALLYMIEEGVSPKLTIKVLGNQWYWNYEYQKIFGYKLKFDSYMVSEEDLNLGELRLLEVDNPLVLPEHVAIRVLITSMDVLHSWAVPAFGVKMDAVPGRLNQVTMYINRLGYFTGQCSELCGVNHGMMPIVVSVVDMNTFIDWVAVRSLE